MFFSQTVEYALRAVVWLAGSDSAQTTQQIAESTQVPPSYLSKVLQSLRRAGLVRGQRGVGGGFALARAPEAITVLEVVESVDPIERIRSCPLGLPAHGTQLCPLHRKLDDALAHVAEAFAGTTIADLVSDDEAGVRPLCGS